MVEYNKDNPLKCFFAFEGYNSQGMALNRLKRQYEDFDWTCVGRSEIDPYAIRLCDAVFPENKDKNYGDISKIDWAQVPDFDLFTYSFPCQAVSAAGTQQGLTEGSGTTSSLLWECKKAIRAKHPRYLLMENVKALVQKKFMPDFQKWLDFLESEGYTTYWKVVNATERNIPQNRERVFAISALDKDFVYHFPTPIPLTKRICDIVEPKADESYYLKEEKIQNMNVEFFEKEDGSISTRTNAEQENS